MGLPWTTILLHGPTIVEAARKLYETARRPPTPSGPVSGDPLTAEIASLRQVVETLAEREVQQAALLAELAQQVEAVRARSVLALVVAAVAVAMALLAVGLASW